ncbi:C-terminal binding protein [Qaidamihabitans albus]|uniref:C-terminal binding protein n=1 Tax=Qaidamihabitans albus TaxID=2795733 RepID=UPI0018F174CE|nr:C-terminal binding protein [Qaidamihabitans albus]
MSTYRVVVTDQVFPTVDIEREMLAEIDAELVVASGGREEVLTVAQDADALLNTYLPIDADFVSSLKRCQVVARYGIGVDNIDLEAAASADIAVTNVPDYSVEEVAAHTLTLLLALLRRLPEGVETVRAGEWNIGRTRPIRRLSEVTVGLVGFGRIAQRLARSLPPLGVRCVVFDPFLSDQARATADEHVSFVDGLEELLSSVDAVSLHCPLTPETRGLIGREQLERMPSHAVLVNTSRGPLVDLDALIFALKSGTLRGAGLDVVDPEPPEDTGRLMVPGMLVTPHMAFYSEEALQESQLKATTQVINTLTGRPLDYRVN